MTAYRPNAHEGCAAVVQLASLAGVVLSVFACFILLVIAP